MNRNVAIRCVGALSIAIAATFAHAQTSSTTSTQNSTTAQTPTGKQKATAIGATTGAVAGAVVGGPVGAVVGAGVGAYVGHEGTDSRGRPPSNPNSTLNKSSHPAASNDSIRSAQSALNAQGYDAGTVDGQYGPATRNALLKFQADKGLTQTGTLDSATLNALGVNS
jgi:Putative peptidoglycan binding domain